MQQHYHIFTDGSLDPLSKQGIAACLITESLTQPITELVPLLQTKRFTETSSTQLELLALLWSTEVLEQTIPFTSSPMRIAFYTDSNNIVTLPQRRLAIEQQNYCSKNGRLLNNHDLYRRFFLLLDKYDCQFFKIAGHKPGKNKNTVDKIFTLVDKASRKMLRASLPRVNAN